MPDVAARKLVVIEMFGGNDGLSTLVPFRDDAYHRARPTLRYTQDELLRLTDERGFHPALAATMRGFHEGRVGLVEGVGFENPFFSHFRCLEVWHTARREGRASGAGWIARLRDEAWPDAPAESIVHVGGDVPHSVWSPTRPAPAYRITDELDWVGSPIAREAYSEAAASCERDAASQNPTERLLERMRADLSCSLASSARIRAATETYRPSVDYPPDSFAQSLRVVAALIQSGVGTRVFSVGLKNFDTHGATQRPYQAKLLARFDAGVYAFLADLEGTQAGRETAVMAYSEFGRRVAENESRGTDHGSAGPLFLFGAGVRGGLHGTHPSLTELDPDGNLVPTTDFRRVYAAAIERWLGADSEPVLGARYAPLDVFG